MQTIKIVQKKPEKYVSLQNVPSSELKSINLDETLINEVNVFEAKYIYHRKFAVKWKDVEEWKKDHISSDSLIWVFGEDPFSFTGDHEPRPDDTKWFDYVTFRDAEDIYYVLIITNGVAYIMNGQGQTIDSF